MNGMILFLAACERPCRVIRAFTPPPVSVGRQQFLKAGTNHCGRTAMQKNKIAESIIIRVGGGIREVYREPLVNSQDAGEPAPNELAAEKHEAGEIFLPDGKPVMTVS